MDAIDNLSDAIDATRDFLTPIRWQTWLKLAIVVFFVSSVGGGAGAPGGDFGTLAEDPTFEDGQSEAIEEELGAELTQEVLRALLVIAAILLVLWLLYAAIGGVMEFVLLESLRETEVHLRRYFRANLGAGLRLFGFRLGVTLVVGALTIAPAAVVYARDGFGGLSSGFVALYVLYGLGLYLLYTVVQRFTAAFVAPIMLLEDRGVLGAWGRFWSTMTGNWAEYVVYLLLVWILSLAVGIAAGFVVAFGAVVLLIPFAIVIFLLLAVGSIGAILAVPIGLLAVVTLVVFAALVWTPITTYFRYYALLLLGDTNADLDLIPEQRAAVRSAGAVPTAGNDRVTDSDRTDTDPAAWDEHPTDDTDGDPWDDSTDENRDTDGDPWDDSSGRDENADPWDDTDDDGNRDGDRGW